MTTGKIVGVVGRPIHRLATPRVRDIAVSVLSILVWIVGPIAGWLIIVESIREFGMFEVAAWVALFVGVVWFLETSRSVRSRWRR